MKPYKRVQKTFHEPSLTKQSFGPACDLNVIVRDFARTGALPQASRPPQYGVAEPDFQEAQFALAAAQSSFEGLAPAVREKYGDLYEVLRAMENPARAAELASDGILYTPEGEISLSGETLDTGALAPAQQETPSPADTAPAGDDSPEEVA